MEVERFDSGDEPYREWLENHPEGYVLNTERSPEASYARFHQPDCSHISGWSSQYRSDPYTGDYRIKVCADEPEPLIKWLIKSRPKSVAVAKSCRSCEPNVEIEGLITDRSLKGETQLESHGEGDKAETKRAAQPTIIQIEDFTSRVKELEGETLLTKTGSEYSVHLDEGKVVFTLLSEQSSEGGRPLPEKELSKVLKRFNETGSLSTGDYRELTVNASYILPILNQIRQEEEDYTPRRAEDLDEPEQPYRVRREVLRIVRDSTHSRAVKKENDYECQICRKTLRLANGDRYAEAHHVHPLGEGGEDTPANIMCVCPNHHALLDYGAIPLDSEEIEGVGSKYIQYHNRNIFEAEQENGG